MKLSRLLTHISTRETRGSLDVDITGVTYDSRKVRPGHIFVALRGLHADGHDYIDAAVAAGAAAILAESDPGHDLSPATLILADNTRDLLGPVASALLKHPTNKLKTVAVTGTNGKTTTTYLIRHIADAAMMRCGLIGTISYDIAGVKLPADRTTPEASDLQNLFAQMRDAGCKAAIFEASSHALDLGRLQGTHINVGVFTNLTQDHLDYHGSMDSYYKAKARLFDLVHDSSLQTTGATPRKHIAVINTDDPAGLRLSEQNASRLKVWGYGFGATATFRASNFTMDRQGSSYRLDALDRSYLVRLPLYGRFNVYNSLAALAASHAMGIDMRACIQALASAPQVPGRLQVVSGNRSFQVIVDYAHTDDALTSVLRTLNELPHNRIITVFGCGGDRDRTKRPRMAKAAQEGSQYVIVTSDNPRTESPEAIVADICSGLRPGGSHEVVLDRKEAIFHAIALAQPGDIVLLAGKGHEAYQEFADRKTAEAHAKAYNLRPSDCTELAKGRIPFDDARIAQMALEARPPAVIA